MLILTRLMGTFFCRSDKPSGTIRSFADRSMGEMSIHDQLVMMQNDEDATEDPSIQEYRCVWKSDYGEMRVHSVLSLLGTTALLLHR